MKSAISPESIVNSAWLKLKTTNSNRGFTLIETLITISIITVIAAMTIPIYRDFQVRNDLDLAQRIFVTAARKAQQNAQNGEANRAWGVAYSAAGTITIYRAASDGTATTTYAARDSAQDDTIAVPSSITPSGGSPFEVNYSLTTGSVSNISCPSGTGTLTLTDLNGGARTVAVNCKGTLTW